MSVGVCSPKEYWTKGDTLVASEESLGVDLKCGLIDSTPHRGDHTTAGDKDNALAERQSAGRVDGCEHLLAIFLFIAGRGKQSTLTRMVRRSIISLGTYRGRLLDDEARA